MDDEVKSVDVKRRPCCSKCRNHSVISHLKGHKRRCLYRECQCPKCQLVDARRDISKRQIALRRLQMEEEEYGSTPVDYDTSTEGYGSSMNYSTGGRSEYPSGNFQQTNQRTWYQSPIRASQAQNPYYPRYPDFQNTNTHYPYPSHTQYRYPSVIRETNQLWPRFINSTDVNSAGNSQNSSEEDDTGTCMQVEESGHTL